jgi:hypothetical protein
MMVMLPLEFERSSRQPPRPIVPMSVFSPALVVETGISLVMRPNEVRALTE